MWFLDGYLWSLRGHNVVVKCTDFGIEKYAHFFKKYFLGGDLRLEFEDEWQRPIRAMGRDGRQ